ncbi:MAG: TlpA family protein disulfide reductase [Bacteroidia bacterium]
MKKIIVLYLVSLLSLQVNAQDKTTISGKFLNCTDLKLELIPSTGNFKDTILVKSDGTFSYSTTAIKTPFRANLTNRKQIQIQLFIAPGYDLYLTADVKDYKTSRSTLNYLGLGSKTNYYWKELNVTNPDTVKWVQKDENTYLNYLKTNVKQAENIKKTFSAENKEPFADYFKESLLLDRKFGHLLGIYSMYAYEHSYSWLQIDQMINKLGYKPLMQEFKDENNLKSSTFCYLLNEYPFYCDNYNAFPEDSLVKKKNNYSLYLASKFYSGKTYDFYATQHLESKLASIYKLDDFNAIQAYIDKIGNNAVKASVNTMVATRIKAVMALKAGATSPLFNLADTSGRFHQLANMVGKVVYIDLWASWCGPCKEETPYLKKIYEKYKGNNKIQIISIASFDAKNRDRRYEIIKKDEMNWLQLEDTDDSFAKSYQANFIPRFIIVDKKGNIVDSDAPRPSDSEKLIEILNREISK